MIMPTHLQAHCQSPTS